MTKKKTIEEFITESKNVHGDTYDYSKVCYINTHIPVIIICKIHGEFLQSPGSHLGQKTGCKICANIKNAINRKTPLIDFINKANLIHNNIYRKVPNLRNGLLYHL